MRLVRRKSIRVRCNGVVYLPPDLLVGNHCELSATVLCISSDEKCRQQSKFALTEENLRTATTRQDARVVGANLAPRLTSHGESDRTGSHRDSSGAGEGLPRAHHVGEEHLQDEPQQTTPYRPAPPHAQPPSIILLIPGG